MKWFVLAAALLAAGAVHAAPLTAAQLAGTSFPAPVDMAAFAPGEAAPSNTLEGRLVLETTGPVGFTEIRNDPSNSDPTTEARRHLPAFDFAFVQDGADLIPAVRGPIVNPHPDWEFILEPGRAWDQPGDGGFSRAAIPFSLSEWNANCTHNGVITFLFKSDGTVSNAAYEIASETCQYRKFDMWGLLPARYVPGPVENAEALKAAYRAEVASRLPVRPLADLAKAHPGFDPAALALKIGKDGDRPTLYGLVADGVNYVSGCETRHGAYPFCDVADVPSYSTAKSVFAAAALMRLEHLYPGARDALIADHIPVCAANPDWKGVTFENALDMATGLYDEVRDHADETNPVIESFFLAPNHLAKLAYACFAYKRHTDPETVWVYHTPDTYLLVTAMNDFIKAKQGADADIYTDGIAEPLWRPLALSPGMFVTKRTYDAAAEPFGGWGLTYHRDDIARLAAWFAAGALIEGKPALDPAMLDAALQRDRLDPGLRAGADSRRYKAGFWARNIAPVLGCKAPVWVPYMSGYGGISVVLLPNGMQFYHFSDSGTFDWAPAAVQADKIKAICP